MGVTNKHSKVKVKSAERRSVYFRLRALGKTYEQIANETGVSPKTVRQHIEREMDELKAEARELAVILRDQQLMDLSQLKVNFYVLACAGDEKALAAYMKILEREAKLTGLDAPVVTKDVTEDPIGNLSAEEVLEEARRRGIEVPTISEELS